jgi:hypothetical protein
MSTLDDVNKLIENYGASEVIKAVVEALYMSELCDQSLERLGNEIGRIPSMRLRRIQ